MENRDKVFAQNWIEQMREDFVAYPFNKYMGRPLTYAFAVEPFTFVNRFWWYRGTIRPWPRREYELERDDLVR